MSQATFHEEECQRVEFFVTAWLSQRGYSPTFDEVRKGAGLTTKSTVAMYLDALQSRGVIEWTRGIQRSIRLPNAVWA